MPHHHHHHEPSRGHAVHAVAGQPTFSLLRLAAWERLLGSTLLLTGLWLLVFLVLA